MSNVPTNLIPSTITQLPEYLGDSTLGYLPYSLEGRTYKVQFANIAAVGAVPSTRVIATGNGLEGGGDLSQNRTISIISHGVGYSQLDFTGVTAGTYGAADTIPVLTVDDTGRVTAVVDTPFVSSNYVPSSRTITAGAGLTGGGQLNNNITIALNPSNATPQSLGAASAGTGTQAARDDHVHPAVDLTDTSETQGVLPLGRGGTGVALSPVVGAVIYADNDSLNQTVAGNAGQVLTSAGGLGAPYWGDLLGGGTVTSVSVVTANGFAGTVANSTTTPAITLTTTVTGLVKANGSALSAATAGTDYVAPGAITTSGLTMATARLLGRTTANSGAVEEITVGTGLSFASGSLTNSAPDQVVSLTAGSGISVSGTYPSFTIAATGGGGGSGTVTSVAASGGTTGLTFSGSPITTSGTLTLGGTLAVANGGTGATVAGTARTNLGAAASGANTDITSIALTTGTISTSPTSGTDIVNKAYADSIASGINFHQAVRLATAAALPANTYNNGSSGVGATLTANANGALSVDSVAAVVGNRILVKNEAAQANNGVYTVTQVGDGSTPYILTRATDFDSAGTGVNQIDAGDFFLVTAGSTQANTSWVQQTPLPITVGTTAIVFTQFGASTTYSAGTGLTLAGTVFSITNTGVSASTYGSASSVPVLAINAQGQVTSASSTSIAIAASQITSGTVSVAQGGTGATTLTANGVLLGNGTSAISATAVGSTGQVLVGNTGAAPSWTSLSSIGVTSFSGGTTGLTPSSGTTGAITLAGTLGVANGGTGATSLTSGYLVKGNGTSAASASVVYDDGTNVGIGTSSPGAKFQVIGSTTVGGYANVAAAFGAGVSSELYVGSLNGNNPYIGSGGAFPLSFNTNSAERMRIDGSGNVGIGTSSPTYRLDVRSGATATAGQFNSTATTAYSPTSYNGGAARLFMYGGNATNSFTGTQYTHGGSFEAFFGAVQNSSGLADFVFQGYNGSAYAERMRIDGSGNVGIGTSSPGYKLVVSAASNTNPIAVISGSTKGLRLGADTNGGIIEGVDNTGVGSFQPLTLGGADIRFTTSTTERMRIDSSGNVGIGTTSPSALLHLNKASGAADLRLSVGGTLYSNIYASSSDVNIFSITSIPLILGTNNTERMRILSGGDVGIGTSTPATKLEVNGGLIAGSENRQTHPPSGPVGFKAQWNYTGGDGETDFYNLYTLASTSFRFYQTTGSGTAQLLYNMRPTTHEFYTGGTLRFSISSTGAITSSDLADAVGYKGLPQNQQTSTYTLALSDMGKHIYATAANFNITIPANATTAFPIGTAITIIVEDQFHTLVPASGVTLVLAGTGGATTGTRTLALGAVATIIKVGTNRWFVSGAGIT